MVLVSLLSARDLSAPSRASAKYLKTRVWRKRVYLPVAEEL